MTADEFRNLALSLPQASEKSHMGHPDFRVGGKIFATLGPDEDWGMVKLTAEQQAMFVGVQCSKDYYVECRALIACRALIVCQSRLHSRKVSGGQTEQGGQSAQDQN